MPPPIDDLLAAAVAALSARGAEVRCFAGADNCVRRREPGEPCTFAGLSRSPAGESDAARLPFVIEVEGLPNLLHELAHVVLLGRVEKDHATEYSKIPFDLATPHGQRLLFEELACCAASSAWHPGDDAAAQAWFEEQVGIQGHFFGFEGDLVRFLAAADADIRAHRAELDAALARAVAGSERALAAAGAPPPIARPRRAFAFESAWQHLRAPYTPRR